MYAVLYGPINASEVGVRQLFSGTVIVTLTPPLAGRVPLDGLKEMLGTQLLAVFQFRLRLCELLLIEAIHVQTLRSAFNVHCVFALKLGGLGTTTTILGAASTTSVTETLTRFDPMANRICPLYVPAPS